jgi:hypothetical protein
MDAAAGDASEMNTGFDDMKLLDKRSASLNVDKTTAL